MKSIFFAVALCFSAGQLLAVNWNGLKESGYYSGPKLTEAELAGKVVLVDCWGVHCPPCRALLPRLEALWKSLKAKPFMLVGNHCQGRKPNEVQALVEANKLTYPIYDWFGLAEGAPSFSGLPFLYVVDHRGKVVYSGHDLTAAEDAIKKAIAEIGAPESLCNGVPLVKFKSMSKKLRFGNPIKSEVSALKSAAKGKNAVMAEEAKAILASIEKARLQSREAIEKAKADKPEEVKKLIKQHRTTWPDDKEIVQ